MIKNTNPPIRALGIILMFLLSLSIKAQTPNNPVLTWDQQVGCIRYDDKTNEIPGTGESPPQTQVSLIEGMMDGNCPRFCEGSRVTYTLQGNNIALVQWQATGGTVEPGSTNTGAVISWGASGMGSLVVTITYSNNTVEVHTICIEKILSPHAEFQINGPDPYQQVFCANNPISFNNISHDNGGSSLVNYLWDFGDGNFSNAFEPTHTYTGGGPYNITLTVTNSCNCSSTYEYHIKVEDARPIEITCLNVTCEYSKETYTANDNCGSGEWEVIGGTIVGGGSGTSWVDVYWDQVDPEDGFGYISYSSHCGCPHWTTVKIPVVLVERAIIKGPDVICQGKQGKYSLPQWPTTDFKWRIDGDPNHPMLVLTDQRNEIMVDAMSPGGYVIEVEYYNTLLGADRCRGQAKYYLHVEENVSINTSMPLTVCDGATKTFSASNGNTVLWEIRFGNTLVHTDNAPTTSYSFDAGAGSYVVTANHNGCISDPLVIEVIPTPVIPVGITGPDKVCLDVPYIYSIGDDDPGAIFVWSVTGGTVIGSNAGNEVVIAFNGATATVTVVKQYIKNGVICYSNPVNYNVSQLVVNPTIINNQGLSQFCSSETYTFTANMHGIVADHLEWQIVGTPPGAPETTNFGSIIGGIHGTTVTVGINEITGGVINGELRLKVTKCGTPYTFTYPINLLQLPNLSFVTDLNEYCPNAGVIFTVTTPGVATGNINIYVDDILKAQNVIYFSGTPTVPILNLFNNPTDDNVQRRITVEYVGGCKFNPRASQPVIVFPETKVTLSSPQTLLNLCFNPVTLYATLSVGLTGTEIFEWYHNNQLVAGANTDIHTINGVITEAGDYYVRVKDKNGCWSQSETITVEYDCGGGSGTPGQIGTPCPTDPNPGLTLTVEMTGCNTFTATLANLGSGIPRWYGSDHISTPGGVATATYTASELGFHWIRVEVDYGSCSTVREEMVVNYFEAGLKAKVSCNGDGNYTVILENNSRVHDPDSAVGNDIVYKYFKGTNQLLSTTDSNVLPGTHTYSIEVSSSSLPSTVVCTKTITLELPNEPEVDFIVPAPLSEYCSDEGVLLKIPNFNQANSYEWLFDGTSFKADGEETLINLRPGQHNIRLRATGPYGCVYISDAPGIQIQINQATFNGAIDPGSLDFCEGSTVTPLSFSPNNPLDPTPSDIIWMRDNVQVATGLTFTPTESGSYWAVLVDPVNGCKYYDLAVNPVIVTMRKPPFASINGNTSVCYGDSTTLTGIYTDPNVEHRWTLNGNALPGSSGSWIAGSTNLTLNLSGLTPGNHNYAFETRDPNDPSCVNSFTAVVVFHAQVATPNISYNVIDCQPYTIELIASGPAAEGTYNWSNGMTGKTIYVQHGGAYSVTYTTAAGCSATGYVQAPHNPERTLWIVPQGCYRICASLNPYLLAPLGVYEHYEWFVNGGTSQTGNNTFVPNHMIFQPGEYQLAIGNSGCMFYSNKPYIDLDYGCRSGSKPSQVKQVTTPVQLTVSPNPATDVAVASFNVGTQYQHATGIAVFDVTGVQRLQQKVNGKQGEVQLNISHLAPGTYIVNLQADGVNIFQQKLIKK